MALVIKSTLRNCSGGLRRRAADFEALRSPVVHCESELFRDLED